MTPYHIEREALCVTAKWRAQLPTVNNRHSAMSAPRLLCPDKRTLIVGSCMSASGQSRPNSDIRITSALPPIDQPNFKNPV
jgi:hypothetical protein